MTDEATPPIAPPQDVSAAYMAHRDDLEGQAAIAEMQQRVKANAEPAHPAAPGTAPKPAATAAAAPTVQDLLSKGPSAMGGASSSVGAAVGKDIGKGVVESPLAVVGGARDAIQNAFNTAKSAGDWAEQKFDMPVLHVGADGVRWSTNEAEKGHRLSDYANLPDSDLMHPSTVTGSLVKGLAQFVTGFKGFGRILGLSGELTGAAGTAANTAKSIGSLATVFDPAQERLSNMIEQFPALSNPVTAYLQAKPGDTEPEGHVKSVLEGMGVGILADGFIRGLGAIRAYGQAQSAAAAEASPEAAAGATPAAPEGAVGQPGAGAQPAAPPEPPPSKGITALGEPKQGPILERPPTGASVTPEQVPDVAPRLTRHVEGFEQPMKLAKDLPPAARAIESRFADQIEADPRAAIEKYNSLPDTKGGKVINADTARELSPDYLKDRTQAAAVHEPASWLMKQIYTQKLKEAPKEGEDNQVLFTMGGTGAGKSTAIKGTLGDIEAKSQIVYDANGNNYDSLKGKIQQAIDAGKKVIVAYVDRDPAEALEHGALTRAMRQESEFGSGRTVPIEAHVDTHVGANASVRQLETDPDLVGKVGLRIINNRLGKGNAQMYANGVEELPRLEYDSVREQAEQKLEEARTSGAISESVYRGFKGEPEQADAGVVRPGVGSGTGGQPEPQREGGRPDDLTPPGGKFQAAGGEPGSETGPTRINFSRIESPDDVKRVMQALANKHAGEIDEARRGTQTFGEIKLNANQEDAWKLLTERRLGQPLNAEQITAARELWVSSAAKLGEVAKIARDEPTEDNLAAFLKMVETHRVIQNEVRGAQTETARALAAMRIPVGPAAQRMVSIEGMLREGYGGVDNVREFAAKVSGLSEQGMAAELDAFANRSPWVRTRDALIQAWTDALLTNPVTQSSILASNATTALWRIVERGIAEKASYLSGSDSVAPGEAAAMWQAYTGGWRDTFASGWKAFKTGQMGAGIGEGHEAYPSKISAEALQLSKDSFSGKAADLLGTVLSVGRRSIAAQHDMALTMAYRAELNAQAVRQATAELNVGHIEQDGFGARVADLIANPPDNIQMNAQAAGKYQAFLDEPGKLAAGLLKIRQDVPAVRAVLPFIKIPARIFSYTMERTPLAPLMQSFQENISAGGARRDLAIAQVSLGTAFTLAIADMTMTGRIKGQGPLEHGLDQAQEREGERNWTVQIGDSWYSYNRIHPAGKLIGLAAAVTEAMVNGQHELKDDADTEKLAIGTALAIAANLSNASYTQGLSNFFAMVHDSKVGGAGEQALLQQVGTLVPSGVSAIARAVDPNQRAVYSMLDEFKSRIPGLSKDLPPRRDLWGYPVASRNPGASGIAGSLLSPAQSRPATHSPIDDEILKQGFNIAMPSTTVSFGQGQSVDLKKYPEAYSRYLELSGHALKDPAWGVGAKDLLDQIVSGKQPALSAVYNLYSNGPDGGKKQMVENIISRFRDSAKKQLLTEFPKVKDEVDQKQAHARDMKMPVL